MYASINAITVILFLFSLSPKKNLRQENHRINYTKIKDEEFFDRLDQILRIACSQFRTLKGSQTEYLRSAKKMGEHEKNEIDKVLVLMAFES